MSEAAVRAAVGLWRSESETETYLAAVVVAAVVAPVLWSHYRNNAITQERNNGGPFIMQGAKGGRSN